MRGQQLNNISSHQGEIITLFISQKVFDNTKLHKPVPSFSGLRLRVYRIIYERKDKI